MQEQKNFVLLDETISFSAHSYVAHVIKSVFIYITYFLTTSSSELIKTFLKKDVDNPYKLK
jgi:hypothetical protein